MLKYPSDPGSHFPGDKQPQETKPNLHQVNVKEYFFFTVPDHDSLQLIAIV